MGGLGGHVDDGAVSLPSTNAASVSSVANSTSLLVLQNEMVQVHAQLQQTISVLEKKLDAERGARKSIESTSSSQQIKLDQANAAIGALRDAYDGVVQKLKRADKTVTRA